MIKLKIKILNIILILLMQINIFSNNTINKYNTISKKYFQKKSIDHLYKNSFKTSKNDDYTYNFLAPKAFTQFFSKEKNNNYILKILNKFSLKKSTQYKLLLYGGPLIYFSISFILGYYFEYGFIAAFIIYPFLFFKHKEIGIIVVNLMKKIVDSEYNEYVTYIKKNITPKLTEIEQYRMQLELESIYANSMLTFPYVDDLALIRKITILEKKLHDLYIFKEQLSLKEDSITIKEDLKDEILSELLIKDNMEIKNHIQKELNKNVFEPKYSNIFRQCQIYIHPKLNFVIKDFIDNIVESGDRKGIYFRQYALRNWKNAKKLAGDLMVPFLIGNISIYDKLKGNIVIKEALIQEKFKGAELSEVIIKLAQNHDIDSIKKIIKLFLEKDIELMKRGLYACDPLFDNAVLTEDNKVLFIDGGMYEISPKASDFYVRGKCHMFNNKFFNSLNQHGLTDKELRELMNYYGEISGIYIMEFDDKYFNFFEEFIKMERYYARGEEDYYKYFVQSSNSKQNPVLWNNNISISA